MDRELLSIFVGISEFKYGFVAYHCLMCHSYLDLPKSTHKTE